MCVEHIVVFLLHFLQRQSLLRLIDCWSDPFFMTEGKEGTPAAGDAPGKPLEIGDRCDVRWKGGDQTLRAIIIERRPLNHRKRKKKDAKPPEVDSLAAEETEYYVHYVDHDRCVRGLEPLLSLGLNPFFNWCLTFSCFLLDFCEY